MSVASNKTQWQNYATCIGTFAMLIACLTFLLPSCGSDHTKFIPTTVSNYYLIQNPPKDKRALIQKIAAFIQDKRKKGNYRSDSYFYQYSRNTAYFIRHKPDPGGHFSEDFDFYEQDKVASFGLMPCPNDSLKQIGLLRFFNNWGNYYQPDTLFNGCDTNF